MALFSPVPPKRGLDTNPTIDSPRSPSMSPFRRSISYRQTSQGAGTITHVDIFTGSLTGTSDRLASILAAKAAQRGAVVTLRSLDDFNPQWYNNRNVPCHLSTRLTVFVVSTHFAGGPSPNAEVFSQWLRLASESSGTSINDLVMTKKQKMPLDSEATGRRHTVPKSPMSRRPSAFTAAIRPFFRMNKQDSFHDTRDKLKCPMHGIQYAVFGVGSSVYMTFNAMGKFVDARLEALGAARMCPLGLGDVTDDIDSVFASWGENLLNLLVDQSDIQLTLPLRLTPTRNSELLVQSAVETPEGLNVVLKSPINEECASVPCALSPSTFRDHYGRRVRLRFRCEFVETQQKHEVKCPIKLKLQSLPPLTTCSKLKAPRKLSRTLSSLRRDAQTLYPSIALQSIRVLNAASQPDNCTQEVALVRLVIQDPELTFQTGDTFGYFPPNCDEVVDAVGSRLGLNMNAVVELSFADASPVSNAIFGTTTPTPVLSKCRHLPFPGRCTVRTILRDFLEMKAVSREFVRVASGFVTEPKEHELLENLTSIEASAAFNREFGETNSGLLKLLEMAPSLRLPFEVLINITPLLRPRLYSIASSDEKNDREFDLVVALGNANEGHGLAVSNFRRALASSETESLQVDNGYSDLLPPSERHTSAAIAMLRGFVATSRFKTPQDLSAPMIMIANGIGIAPLRGLLQHREIEVGDSKVGSVLPATAQSPCGKILVLFGCSDKDSLIFESELRAWESAGFIELHVAYSSEPDYPRQHVQDLVAAQMQEISALMSSSPEAQIYICGKGGMARAVNQLLSASGIANNGSNWYEQALVSGRYIENIS